MRPCSARQARRRRERRTVIAAMAEAPGGQVCARCSAARAVDPHERLMRSQGGSIVDPANIVALCRACHDWVHLHPAAAYQLGWLIRGNHTIRRGAH